MSFAMVSKRRSRKRHSAILLYNDDSTLSFDTRLVRLIKSRDYRAHVILQQLNNPSRLVDSSRTSLLHIAAECGNDSVLQHLVDLGSDVDAQDDRGRTALLLAVLGYHEMSVKLLLEARASIDLPDRLGRHAFGLTLASYSMRSSAASMFLRRIRSDFQGDSEAIARRLFQADCPLCRALYLGDVKLVKMMIALGSDVNLGSYEQVGMRPLHVAVELNDLAAVKLLLASGAEVAAEDAFGRPALFYSYLNERDHSQAKLSIIKALVAGDLKYKTSSYTTVLKYGDRAVVRTVLNSNVDMFARDELHGGTVLHYLAENEQPGVIEELAGKSFDVDVVDAYGNGALLVAASRGNADTVEYLLERGGADPNLAHYRFGYTPLYDAFVNSTEEKHGEYRRIVEVLLRHGADAQVRTKSPSELFTVFDVAIRKRRFKLAEPVIAYLALLEARGCEIEEFVVASIEAHPRLRMFLRMCRRRLQRMRMTVVCGYVTLYEFLTASDRRIFTYARNAQLVAKLKIVVAKCKCYSSYGFVLRERLDVAVEWVSDREKAAALLGELTGLRVDSVVIDMIISLLRPRELRIMSGNLAF